jgi:predicted Zn-dependent peptidase
MNYTRTTLHNGLRLLTAPMPGMRSASIAFFFTVGSRYEAHSIAGISHFIEHMLFKGSRQYPTARLISEAIEGVGGIFNASTGKELTSYTARFDPIEIEKERAVIIEELSATLDDPQEWVNLLIDEAMWPGLPLGRDDAGFVETVAHINREQLLRYMDEYYIPNALVISVAGNIDHDQVVEATENLFGDWEMREHPKWQACLPPRHVSPLKMIQKDTEQTNICLATLGTAHDGPEYYPMLFINALLGDGMSSRLFQTIREEQGLAYDIGTYVNTYYETGDLVVSAGVDPTQTRAAIRAIVMELDRLIETEVPEDELNRMKAYMRGGVLLGLEGTQQVATWAGSQESLRNKVIDVDEVIAHIDAITSQDIQRVAQSRFAPEWRRLAVIGPDDPQQAAHLAALLTRA